MKVEPAGRTSWRTARRGGGWLAALAGMALAAGCAGNRAVEAGLTAAQRELNVASFDVMWETVRDRHWDPTLGGLDWEAVRAEMRPQAAQAETMSGARAVLGAALSRLSQSHFGIVPGEAYADVESATDAEDGGECGISVRVIDREALVKSVWSESSAAGAGVKPGWRIVRVNDRPVRPTIDRLHEEYADSTMLAMLLARAIEAKLDGPAGATVRVQFVADGERRVDLELRRGTPRGKLVRLGNMPPANVWFESRRLPGGAGYIAFNIFLDPAGFADAFEAAMREFRDARGIVLDLRGNPGGLGAMSMGVAGWFVPRSDRPLGTMKTRGATIHFAVFPRAERYEGPLAILVDGLTASTSEILAGGLQDLKRARVFGEPTAGAALPSMFTRLPNNDGFQYAIADYESAAGRRLEGAGVQPDVEVRLTRAALLAGRDPALDAALAWVEASPGAIQATD